MQASTDPKSGGETRPGFLTLVTLTKRGDFLAAARAKRVHSKSFVLQFRKTNSDQTRIGFTCSKKVGNAVARNRAKRRLREIARLILPSQGKPGFDYVLIGRAGVTATTAFDQLQQELAIALKQAHP